MASPIDPLPAAMRAFVVTIDGADVRAGLRDWPTGELLPGEVTVRVSWSSVNYKDGLAIRPGGGVARISPLIPGIDLAGTVVASDAPAIPVGREVLVHGYDLGTSHHGGYAEYARVPADWVVPLPDGLEARQSMAIGTAGFTAAMAVVALEDRGLRPGDGPVLVTGATGGLGRLAVSILAGRGHEVWASTGKPDETERLRALGAAGVVSRDELLAGPARPLATARWTGAIDAVGGPTLPAILRTLRRGAAVASCGNAGGNAFEATVLPFILRGVAVLGMDSVAVPIADRRRLWERLANAGDLRPAVLDEDLTEVALDDLRPALEAIVAGGARGRWVVRVAGSA